jgi:Helix-turn-helix of DDE superfamily endonuclease
VELCVVYPLPDALSDLWTIIAAQLQSDPYTLELISIYGILCLRRKEATTMGTLRFADLQTRPTEVLDLTSLTVDEFRPLVPPFEAAFQTHMADWRLDGRPRTARQYTTYKNCPLPMPEDRLLFILVYLKTYPLQVVQGRLFGMGQSKAHQWIHVLLVVLRATLRALGDTPSRSVAELAQRLGVAEAEVTAMVVPPEPPPAPATVPAPASTSPRLGMMGPNGASGVPRIRLSRRAVIAARKNATR